MSSTRRLHIAFNVPPFSSGKKNSNESASSEVWNSNLTRQVMNQTQDPWFNQSLTSPPYPVPEQKQIVASEDQSSSLTNAVIGLSAFMMLGFCMWSTCRNRKKAKPSQYAVVPTMERKINTIDEKSDGEEDMTEQTVLYNSYQSNSQSFRK